MNQLSNEKNDIGGYDMKRYAIYSIVLCLLLVLFAGACSKSTDPDTQTVKAPVFTPPSGTYDIGQSITISCPTEAVEIRYTTDGSEPDSLSALYSAPLIIPSIFPYNTNTGTIKAKAYKQGYQCSITKKATYSVTYANTVATPVISPQTGTIPVESPILITCTTPETQIHYTLDGSEPTVYSTLYDDPFLMQQTDHVTVKAKAFRNYWNPSPSVIANYNISVPEPALVFVQGGTFNNGTSDVTVSSFYMGKYELTQAEYQAVMGSNPAYDYGIGDTYPVYIVSWFDAIEYCNRRSIQEELPPCYSYSYYGTNPDNWPAGWNSDWHNHINLSCSWTASGYRLPTEMEWMYAARGGNLSHGYTYSGSNDLNAVGWYRNNWGNDFDSTVAVGCKLANELGLYDMSGNVWELCWDIYDHYPSGAQTNPVGPSSGQYRVSRGGGWLDYDSDCSVNYRRDRTANDKSCALGFRYVRSLP
jgi:formylglycine-generating enzyme required for sulfatase activity